MDEKEYRSVYNTVNNLKCAFEKAVLTRRYACSQLIRRNIGEREAAGCSDADACDQCTRLLQVIRQKASFALHTSSSGKKPLAHAKEIKVQCGGLSGLELLIGANKDDVANNQQLLQLVSDPEPQSESPSDENELLPGVQDIYKTINQSLKQFEDFDSLPWPEIVKSISSFKGRKKKQPRH